MESKENVYDNDLDFEEAQALLEQEKQHQTNNNSKSHIPSSSHIEEPPQHYSNNHSHIKSTSRSLKDDTNNKHSSYRDLKRNSNSNTPSHIHHHHDRSHKSKYDHYHKHSHSKSKQNSHSRSRSRSRLHHHHHHRRSSSHSHKDKIKIEKSIEEAMKQAHIAERCDSTVQMYSLARNVNEKKIFDFFCSAGIGRIIDIKLIRDSKTGKSKNCCYVEFDSRESCQLALSINGTELMGQPVQIVRSQYEKNRHAAAAKFKKEQIKEQQRIHLSSATEQIDLNDAPMKIYVGGLTENLADITENDLQNIFQFGAIDSIELHRDPITGKCKGFAFIQFHRASSARQAIAALNGFNYKGKSLKVGEANENNTYIQHDENSESRNELIHKLSRTNNGGLNLTSISNNTNSILESIDTGCMMITNMFSVNDRRFVFNDEFFNELYCDVEEACEEHGKVECIWIDRNSQGNVWVKYDKERDRKSAFKAMMALSGKLFDERPIVVKLVPESLFNVTVPKEVLEKEGEKNEG